MHAAEKQKLFTCKISVCLLGAATAMQAILPPACILNYSYGPLHVHASRALRHACRAGRPRGRRGCRAKKRLARSLPPTLSPIRPGASGRHASFDAVQRELRPRYKSLAKGTCEFRSDSLGSIVMTLKSAFAGAEDWTELLLRVRVCALFPRLMPVLRVPLFHATSFRLVPA